MSESVGQAIAGLTQAITESSCLTADDALEIATLIATLQRSITPDSVAGSAPSPEHTQDPRFALALASSAETIAQESLRTQIYTAHLVEATSAHTLTVEELDAARAGIVDFDTSAQRTGQRPSMPSATALSATWLHIEYFEATRRMDSAHHVYAQFDYQHQQYPPQFPLLTQRFRDHDRPPAEVLSVARRLNSLEPKRDEFALPTTSTLLNGDGQLLESELNEKMAETDPKTRRKAINEVMRAARERQSEDQPEAQEGIFRKGLHHGLVHYEVVLRPLRSELFESLLAQSDNPRSGAGQAAREPYKDESSKNHQATDEHPDFVTDEEAAGAQEPDSAEVSVAGRHLNALMLLLGLNSKRLKRLEEKMTHRTTPDDDSATEAADPDPPVVKPQVVVTLTLEELEGRAKTHGITAHGFKLSATDLRQTLAEAKIIPMVLGGKGEILDIGRSHRKHPRYMRLGVAVRDGGCLVPGCSMEPERCNIHHIRFWSQGGVTAVYWSAMLCDTHHHDVHAGLIKVIPDDGVPKVILPQFMDPTQTPVRNTYHRADVA